MIVLNGLGLTKNAATGIQRNTLEILFELDKIVDKNWMEIVIPSNTDIKIDFKNISIVKLDLKKIPKGKTTIWKKFTFKHYVKKKNAVSLDMLLVFPYYGCDVVMIYDCIPELFPHLHKGAYSKFWRALFLNKQRKSINKAKVVLTDSHSAKCDIERFYPKSKGKVEVVPCGWQHINRIVEDESIINKLNLKKNEYFFSLGSRLLHKNIKWIVEAAKQNPNETFVSTGAGSYVGNGGEDVKNLIYTGYLNDSEIKALMHYCKAFIQPSMYEGFGLPPMEAMSVGARCIVSTGGSLPEVYDKSVWYIDPYNYSDIDLKRIMSAPIEPNDVILNKYSWEKSAKMLKDVLDNLDNRKK